MQRDERRVLDRDVRAEVHHLNGAYAVKTGLGGLILHDNADAAWMQAAIHNHMNQHELLDERRTT